LVFERKFKDWKMLFAAVAAFLIFSIDIIIYHLAYSSASSFYSVFPFTITNFIKGIFSFYSTYTHFGILPILLVISLLLLVIHIKNKEVIYLFSCLLFLLYVLISFQFSQYANFDVYFNYLIISNTLLIPLSAYLIVNTFNIFNIFKKHAYIKHAAVLFIMLLAFFSFFSEFETKNNVFTLGKINTLYSDYKMYKFHPLSDIIEENIPAKSTIITNLYPEFIYYSVFYDNESYSMFTLLFDQKKIQLNFFTYGLKELYYLETKHPKFPSFSTSLLNNNYLLSRISSCKLLDENDNYRVYRLTLIFP
jgi:hypothetical protein